MPEATKMPTEEELELQLYNRINEHLELMDRYDSLGKAVTSELGRMNIVQQVDVAQAYMPEKIKLDSESVNYMSEMLKKLYKELNGVGEDIG